MTKIVTRRESLSALWSDIGPQNRYTLPSTLWGISHYFDGDTCRFFGSRVLDGYAYEYRGGPSALHRSVLVVARESSREGGHRVVVIVGGRNGSVHTARIACSSSRHSASVYQSMLCALAPSGHWTRKQGWTLRALMAHVQTLATQNG